MAGAQINALPHKDTGNQKRPDRNVFDRFKKNVAIRLVLQALFSNGPHLTSSGAVRT